MEQGGVPRGVAQSAYDAAVRLLLPEHAAQEVRAPLRVHLQQHLRR